MGNKLSIPFMSLVYFTMAIVWVVGALITFGQTVFWLFIIMIPINIFAGMKIMRR